MATFMNKEEELQSKVETLEHRIERLERALKNMSEQDSNCNLPHVSNLVCPTHGTMLYKHPNGLAYCSLCNYSISWQTCC